MKDVKKFRDRNSDDYQEYKSDKKNLSKNPKHRSKKSLNSNVEVYEDEQFSYSEALK